MKQREIWLINLDPTLGAEMKKSRPCVILNSNEIGKLPLKVIAPLTDFKHHYEQTPWMVRVDPNAENKLIKISAIDLFQVRSLSDGRLIKKIGTISEAELERSKLALKVVFEINS